MSSSFPQLWPFLMIVFYRLVENDLSVVAKFQLVVSDDDVLNADQRHPMAVSAGLRKYAFAGVDHHDGHVGGRRAGDHIARVLFVARSVGNNKLALVGRDRKSVV